MVVKLAVVSDDHELPQYEICCFKSRAAKDPCLLGLLS